MIFVALLAFVSGSTGHRRLPLAKGQYREALVFYFMHARTVGWKTVDLPVIWDAHVTSL